jgi:hypothetical protein
VSCIWRGPHGEGISLPYHQIGKYMHWLDSMPPSVVAGPQPARTLLDRRGEIGDTRTLRPI